MHSWVSVLGLLVAAVPETLASCAYGTHLHPRAAAFEAPKFGYDATKGPVNWYNLDPVANALCGHGHNQSPINLAGNNFKIVPAKNLKIKIPDFKEGAEFENLGTTVEVVAKGGNIEVDGSKYTLQQFHFHLPSEHLEDGDSMAMEMHMVWTNAKNEIAVIGVFIDLNDNAALSLPFKSKARSKIDSTPSAVIEAVLGSVDKIATPGSTTHTKPLAMSEIVKLLNSGSFQSYSGSLTTPPCHEGVKWFVSTQKISISTRTYRKAGNVIGFNARYPQNAPGQENLLDLYADASEHVH
ncbi:carbonic anhydrase [Fusarium albosuccineum]|uniref:carbonic anhydrase n=1 Tax=Fusarium albosuccineum TaxID=1237068 RepID=A0A8H4L3F1_9HYPO|nr:carbonic anhydrase [Fusarium albosuccineum]